MNAVSTEIRIPATVTSRPEQIELVAAALGEVGLDQVVGDDRVDDDDQLDAVPSTASPGLICVSSATYLHLMRTLEMIVASLAPLGSCEAKLTTAEAAAVFAAFCREWHVFTRLAHDAAILGRAFDGLDRVLDDLPVWSYDDPQPPLAVFASERNRQLAELIE